MARIHRNLGGALRQTCVDRGGTFTDVVTVDERGAWAAKIPSDRAVIGELAQGDLRFGTTVATNAVLEGAGVPVTLFVTRGFADLVELGDMSRRALFDPDARWPRLPVAQVVEVDGRLDVDGEPLEPLVLPTLPEQATPGVAIALLHSGRNDAHEQQLAAWVKTAWPSAFVSLGSALSPSVGYVSRVETAVLDAGVTPLLQRAMAGDALPSGTLAIRSDATLVAAPALRAPDALLSGPAGGVLAVGAVARQAGFRRAIGLDMGGTSTDVCLIDADRPLELLSAQRIAGLRVQRPSVVVHTIAAGGGSIAQHDGRRLRIGPESAGAHPGPQCYGRGGPPTVTDAAAALGLVDPAAFEPPLQLHAIDLPAPAEDILTVAREAMAHAVRTLAERYGADLADHALVAYGGAAGQHAAAVAERLGVHTVLVHPMAAVLSAWGQLAATRGASRTAPIWAPLHEARARTDAKLAQLDQELVDYSERAHRVRLRVAGTDHGIELDAAPWESLPARFAAEANRQGLDLPADSELEVVDVTVYASDALSEVPPAAEPDPFGLGSSIVRGPAVLRAPTTSVAVPAGWEARCVDGLLRLDGDRQRPVSATERGAVGAALWSQRFMAVAEQGGEHLRRLARSVNIRERLDFSCAVFDGEGRLVANAPHIPVHLGAMGASVRDLLAAGHPLPDGSAWLCNDPTAGGSHLPDLTVITPVEHGRHRFFVACRGHHVDVGGSTPGSMPPRARHLSEEGLVFRRQRLDGADLDTLLRGSRRPDTVAADLRAQIAANRTMAQRLRALGPSEVLSQWMTTLRKHAAQRVRELLPSIAAQRAEDTLDGCRLCVALRREVDTLVVDFSGTEGPHPGNLNAPRAVVHSAVLYALRLLVGRGLALNEGALEPVHLVIPPGSLLDPPPTAAVAGGNVETSQRLVDLLLRALNLRAASQGTMNNLTFGGDDWAHYETLGGGQGASHHGPGASGHQVHMTNTRATDPEVLEARTPLRLRRFSLLPASGGPGAHPGGDGILREIEATSACTATLLAAWRPEGAPGLAGGGAGAPGRAEHLRQGAAFPWDGDALVLQPGDRVRVFTPGGGGWGEPL